jgi:glycosyltransferase involved in cell wall biosynthesis
MGLEVVFLPSDFQRREPYAGHLESLGVRILDDQGGADDWKDWLRDKGSTLDYVFFNKPEPANQFLETIMQSTRAGIIYQSHDLHYLRMERQADLAGDQSVREEAQKIRKLEDFIIPASDVVLTFSESEARIIGQEWPGRDVVIVPLYYFDEPAPPPRSFAQREGLVFVGSCDHEPNHDGLTWFCDEVLPAIREKLPEVFLQVVGAEPPPDILERQSDHVRILGKISDEELAEAYSTARMMVVPLRYGAGVKGKVVEALHFGLPLVSTTSGLEGIPELNSIYQPRDGAEEMAAEIIALYADPERLENLAVQGQEYAGRHFSREKAHDLMKGVLASARHRARANDEAAPPMEQPTLIAFHLPQYHPIPENDEWWGEGFTDWTNVKRATPLFEGHYQPHVPADLGYYDLREESVRLEQAKLASQYGIGGFCYYHYWFNGRRLLEQPVDAILASGKPDFPFCLCWANENWTRRWDGAEHQVLMQQDYSDEDDRDHIRSLIPVFQDPRYIRFEGKPIFLVYRTGDMPDPARTTAIWREEARAAGIGELYLCHVESLEKKDAAEIGFDAAVEFAPDWKNKGPLIDGERAVQAGISAELLKTNYLHEYSALVNEMQVKEAPDYTWFRCVTPSWDNTARRKTGANVFIDANPRAFRGWLESALADTQTRFGGQESLLFINAWNEWAEGCHLEPDEQFGRGNLEAVRDALKEHRAAFALDGTADELGHVKRQAAKDRFQAANDRYRLEVAIKRLEQANRRLDELRASTSWRLTRPVRWLKETWQAIRSHGKDN